jgi:hypothetical protein
MASIVFESPASYWIAGPSGSGKSCWISKLIHHRKEMFREVPAVVHYCYKEWQPLLFGEMQSRDGVHFHEGLPSLDTVKSWSAEVHGRHMLLILDDLQTDVCKTPEMSTLFTVLGHHSNCSIGLVVQNLFPRSSGSTCIRDLFLNVHYICLFNSKRDKLQISNLGRQVFPGQNSFLMSAYNDAVSSRKYSCLVLDLHPDTSREYMVRTNVFPGELTWVYRPK